MTLRTELARFLSHSRLRRRSACGSAEKQRTYAQFSESQDLFAVFLNAYEGRQLGALIFHVSTRVVGELSTVYKRSPH